MDKARKGTPPAGLLYQPYPKKTLMPIMEDICEAHQWQSESGGEHSAVVNLKQDLEDAANVEAGCPPGLD